jgi:gamma-glutamyltranspeptidase/glutathione hydrolase
MKKLPLYVRKYSLSKMFSRTIIAAGDINTANAIKEVLLKGGNAFDGAVAGVFAAYMAEPALTSPGGGGFLSAYTHGKDKEPVLYDFFVETPPKRLEKPELYPIEVDFGDAVQIFHIGAGSIAVPGVVEGLLLLHRERGKLPLEDVLKPALNYAREGIYLTKRQASFVKLLEPIFTATGEARKIFAPGGELINEKTKFQNPEYGEFLEKLIEEGSWAFYEGDIADRIDELSQKHNGIIRKEDLARYQVVERKPLKITFKGYEIFLNPPPSAGGILIAFTLLLLNNEDLNTFGSKEHISKLIEALFTTQSFRRENVDGKLHSGELEKLLKNRKLLDRYLKLFYKRLNLWGNTTHIAVSDKEGNIVSTTTTNGEGSGYIIPGYGVMLNNMLGEEDLNPQGFFKYPPYVRLPSMMCPTIVLKDGEPILGLGSAGSNRIRSAILQVLLNVLVFKMGLQEAVDAPRLHVEENTVYLEPALGREFEKEIEKLYKVVRFREKNLFFGGVQAVAPLKGEGGGDTRRGGVAITL